MLNIPILKSRLQAIRSLIAPSFRFLDKHENSVALVLLFVFFLLTFPQLGPIDFFNPRDYGDSDNSWIFSLNYAVATGLTFGRDVIFTYGPLTPLLVPLDMANHVGLAAIFKISLQLLWCVSLFLLRSHFPGRFFFPLFLGISAFCALPIGDVVRQCERTGILVLVTANFLALAQLRDRPVFAAPAAFVAALALLAKFNVGVACGAMLGGWLVIFVFLRRGRLARSLASALGFGAAIYLISVAVLFAAFGGPLTAFGDFLESAMLVAGGYSTHMHFQDHSWQVPIGALLVAACGILLLYGVVRRRGFVALLGWLLPTVFVLYKSTVVRQVVVINFVPNALAIIALLMLVLTMARSVREKRLGAILAFAGFAAGLWMVADIERRPARLLSHGAVALFRSLELALAAPTQPRRQRTFSTAATGGQKNRAIIEPGKTVDVYPRLTAIAWDYNFRYQPRFTLQSYSAYHPKLDLRAAELYNSERRPDYIVYGHDSIDHTHPLAVDPQTWTAIYRWYDPVGIARRVLQGGSLLLKKRATPRLDDELEVLKTVTLRSNEPIEIPSFPGRLTLIRVYFRPTLIGRLAGVLYAVDCPRMQVVQKDGTAARFRLIWRNAESGFVASDLVAGVGQALRLFEDGPSGTVHSLKFHGNEYFEDEFVVELATLELITANHPGGN